jgi:glutamate/aspartate transport system permease protein
MARYSWNWGVLFTEPYFGFIVSGFTWTVLISLAGWAIALTLGSTVGIARTVRQPLIRASAAGFVELFRNVPLIVQMFLWFFVLPEVVPRSMGIWLKRGLPDAEFWSAVVCLGIYTACRVAEQVRAGIQSISRGQTYAGLANGLRPTQVYRYILLPVAFRLIVPTLTTEFLSIFKNSSLALTIGVLELTGRTRQISEYTAQPLEMFLTATALYGAVTLGVAIAMREVEKRVRVPGLITGAAK